MAGRPRRRRRRPAALLLVLVALLAVVGYLVWHRGKVAAAGDGGTALDPSAFSTGACVAYPPTAGDRHTTVFLDAGHGGVDPGAIGTTTSGITIEESTETLPVELEAATLLRAAGFRVVVSRTADTPVVRLTPADRSGSILSLQGAHDDVVARDECADLAGAAVLVGIYFDSGGSASDAGSLTTWDPARPFAAANQRLATLVQHDVLAAMNARGWDIPDAGVVTDDQEGSLVPTTSVGAVAEGAAHYGHVLLLGPAAPGYFTTPSAMPGALIEPLYLTDPFEGSIAASADGHRVIAEGLARAVEAYFGPERATS